MNKRRIYDSLLMGLAASQLSNAGIMAIKQIAHVKTFRRGNFRIKLWRRDSVRVPFYSSTPSTEMLCHSLLYFFLARSRSPFVYPPSAFHQYANDARALFNG